MPVSVNVTLSNPAQTVSYTLPSGAPASSARELVVGVYAPGEPGDYPVIVYSHGHGGSSIASQGAGLTAQALADRGYIVLMPNHLDSIALYPDWIRSQFTVYSEAAGLHRAADMQFVLTQATTLVSRLPPGYSADLSAPVAAGHSNGAFTSAVLGGLSTGLADYVLQPGNPYGLTSVTDARFKALVLISPQGRDTSWAQLGVSAWEQISVPTLIITGDEDDEPLGGPGRWEGRLDAFRLSDHGATLAMVYRGAGHNDIGGATAIPGLTTSITASIDRFLDGWLGGDPSALSLLNDPASLLAAEPLLFQAFAREAAGTPGLGAVLGGATADILTGLQSDDVICGGDGDDQITGGAGNDHIFGGDGHDIVLVSGAASAYRLLRSGDDFILKGSDGRDSLTGIEAIRFSDGKVLELNRIYGSDMDVPADGRIPEHWLSGLDDPEVLPGPDDDRFLQLDKDQGEPQVMPMVEAGPAGLVDARDLAVGLLPDSGRMALYLSGGQPGSGHHNPLDGGPAPDPWG